MSESKHTPEAWELFRMARENDFGSDAPDLAAEVSTLRADFTALQHALVGDTGASAILTATNLRAEVEQLRAALAMMQQDRDTHHDALAEAENTIATERRKVEALERKVQTAIALIQEHGPALEFEQHRSDLLAALAASQKGGE